MQTLQTQVGGHQNSIFKLESGKILKHTSIAEVYFYTTIAQVGQNTPLSQFMPEILDHTADTITMDDLALNLTHACIADVKIGTRLYDDYASDAKRLRMVQQAETTTTGSMGLRICGFQVDDCVSGIPMKYGKVFGRSLGSGTLSIAFQIFFSSNLGIPVNKQLLRAFIRKVEALLDVLKGMSGLRLYASSILLMYDGSTAWSSADTDLDWDACARLKLIDFAHSHYTHLATPDHPHYGPDVGAIFGLTNLQSILQDVVKDCT